MITVFKGIIITRHVPSPQVLIMRESAYARHQALRRRPSKAVGAAAESVRRHPHLPQSATGRRRRRTQHNAGTHE